MLIAFVVVTATVVRLQGQRFGVIHGIREEIKRSFPGRFELGHRTVQLLAHAIKQYILPAPWLFAAWLRATTIRAMMLTFALALELSAGVFFCAGQFFLCRRGKDCVIAQGQSRKQNTDG